jgi:hypothetical protein
MATKERNSGPYWADLFLALLYSGTVILFVAWVSRWEIPNPPGVLEKVIGSGWAWVTSAASAALITAIFGNRLSRLTLVWTIFLTISLAGAIYVLRTPKSIPPERWKESEGGRPPIDWEVKYDGSAFSCPPVAGFSSQTLCTATGWDTLRAVHRFQAPSDNNQCNFFGLVAGDTVTGTYTCVNGGPYPWTSTIVREKAR